MAWDLQVCSYDGMAVSLQQPGPCCKPGSHHLIRARCWVDLARHLD